MMQQEQNWWTTKAPRNVTSATGTSGTYQASADNRGQLHWITSNKALRILGGTGSSVTATSGFYLGAGVAWPFIPSDVVESLGWASYDGSSADVTICITSK